MELFVAAALVALVLAVLFFGARSIRTPSRAPDEGPGAFVDPDGRAVVTLDMEGVDAGSEAAARLVDEVAARTFVALPEAKIVEVHDRDGNRLGERRREKPREVAIPEALYEPHARRSAGPSVSPGPSSTMPGVRRDLGDPAAVPTRPVADRFALPDAVRDLLDDPDDAVALVRAILEAAGRPVSVTGGEVLRSGDEVLVVLRAPIGEPLGGDALNHAYAVFRDSGARHGVVVTPGFMNPSDVRRREVFAPQLLHAGPEGIQRMADAVALGADPVAFAAAPPLAPASH